MTKGRCRSRRRKEEQLILEGGTYWEPEARERELEEREGGVWKLDE